MALIKCSECSAEISDKANCCPKCGAPVEVHKWRCSKCGNMISKESCPFCSNAQKAVNTNTVDYKSSVGTTPAFVEKNKRNLGVLITFLVIATIVIIIIGFVLQNGDSGKNKSIVKHGTYCDAYDDDGDGWVDRVYDRDLGQWWEHQFQPGEFAMDDAE